MQWFIKKYIYSNIVMKTVVYDLSEFPVASSDRLNHLVDGKQLTCCVVKELNNDLNAKIQQAISRMDATPYFDINEAHKRFEKGYYFVIAMVEEEVIGWTWAGINKVYFKDFNCCLMMGDSSAFSYNTFVDKDYRGKRVNQYIKDELFHCLKKNGYKKIWGLVYPWNKAALKSNFRFGFKLSDDYRFLKLVGFNFHFSKVLK